MITVYFDTNFYVDLARADKKTFDALLERMNALHIRNVYSDTILMELLANPFDEGFDDVLIERLSRFNIDSFHIHWSNWSVLLQKGEERRKVHATLRASKEQMSLLNNFKPSAAHPPQEHVDSFIVALEDMFQSMGMKNPKELAQKELFIQNMKSIHQSLTSVDYSESEGLKSSIDSMFDSAFKALEIPPPHDESESSPRNIIEAYPLNPDVLRDDVQLREIGYQKAREKWLKKATDNYRIFDFVNHKDDIDCLQINKRQLDSIQNQKATVPYLAQLKLSSRCFYGENPSDSLDQIEVIALKMNSDKRNDDTTR